MANTCQRGGNKHTVPTDDGTYLRGAQMTNSEGIVRFTSRFISKGAINAEVSPYIEYTGRETYNKTDTIYSDEGLMQAHYDVEKVIAAINIGI